MAELAAQRASEFTRTAYLRAKVLDSLASQTHEQSNLFASLGQEELAEAYSQASNGLHAVARKLFPLYPHDEFVAGREWANANGFSE